LFRDPDGRILFFQSQLFKNLVGMKENVQLAQRVNYSQKKVKTIELFEWDVAFAL
jgi:hypothetical protein